MVSSPPPSNSMRPRLVEDIDGDLMGLPLNIDGWSPIWWWELAIGRGILKALLPKLPGRPPVFENFQDITEN